MLSNINLRNELALHEAIIIALTNINSQTFAASFLEIAIYIQHRHLFNEGNAKANLATRVKTCTTKSKGKYSYLFEQVNEDWVRLRIHNAPVSEAAIVHIKENKELNWLRLSKPPIAKLRDDEGILRH